MTAKKKAEELVHKFDELLTYKESKAKAKECALIAVDQILEAPFNNSQYVGEIPQDAPDTSWYWDEFNKYWNEVKEQIEGL